MDATAVLGERMKAPAMWVAAGRVTAAGREPGEGWQGWHLYLVWAEDRVDTVQHLFCVFSLGVPTDNDLCGESVGGRREKDESCDCSHTIAQAPCPWQVPNSYLFEGVMEDSGGPGHLW